MSTVRKLPGLQIVPAASSPQLAPGELIAIARAFEARLAGLTASVATQEEDLARLRGDHEAALLLMEGADGERAKAARHAQDLERALSEQRAHADHLRDALSKRPATTATSTDVVEAVEALAAARPTPRQCLTVIEHLYGARLVVLPSAWKSAGDVRAFRFGTAVFDLLRRLASDYWTARVEGRSDADIHVFGTSEYAPHESETTRGNACARGERTFRYAGKDLVMWRHLRVGNKRSPQESLRIHFEWDASEKKIIIGHCGQHLYVP